MGHWNGTCAVTNLPILCGEPVVMYLLQRGTLAKSEHYELALGGRGAYCNADVYFRPIWIPLTGKYDGYGGMFPDKNQSVWVEYLLDKFNETYHVTLKTLGDLVAEMQKDRDSSDRNLPDTYSWFFVRVEVFKKMGKLFKFRGNSNLGSSRVLCTIEAAKLQHRAKKTKLGYDPKCFTLTEDLEFRQRYFLDGVLFFDFDDNFWLRTAPTVEKKLIQVIKQHMSFCRALELSRRLWLPPGGAGSQSEDLDIHGSILAYAQEELKGLKKLQKELWR